MLAAKRTRPLVIAGPKDTASRMREMCDALFPGMEVMKPKFHLRYIELELDQPNRIGDLVVTPQHARHTRQTHPMALRVEVGGKVVSYTGDGEFTEQMAKVGKDADLLVAECYSHQKLIKWHLNYHDIEAHQTQFGAKRIILTHMSEEMLAHTDEVPEETARDGLFLVL